jgi:hypothetical protein
MAEALLINPEHKICIDMLGSCCRRVTFMWPMEVARLVISTMKPTRYLRMIAIIPKPVLPYKFVRCVH